MIDKLVDRPERVFLMWGFTVGMSRLLLRSTKSDTHPTRIDVLFQNVKSIKLPTHLDGLVVTEVDARRAVEITEETGLVRDKETVFFDVELSGRIGFVVAGVVVEDEDTGEYYDPSRYWPDVLAPLS